MGQNNQEINRYAIIKDAVKEFGYDSQLFMMLEEAGELIVALARLYRGRADETDVITEVADVLIMARQMEFIFGVQATEEEIDNKLERLERRIEEYRERKKQEERSDPKNFYNLNPASR